MDFDLDWDLSEVEERGDTGEEIMVGGREVGEGEGVDSKTEARNDAVKYERAAGLNEWRVIERIA